MSDTDIFREYGDITTEQIHKKILTRAMEIANVRV